MNCMIVRSWKDGALRGAGVLGLLSALAMAPGVQAFPGPLGLTSGVPDIASAFIDVSYDATSNTLTASGFATDLFPLGNPGPSTSVTGGSPFTLMATVDDSGFGGGLLTIRGTVAGLGFNSGTLLTGTLTDLGFDPGPGNTLQFLADVTGGDAAGLFGNQAGIILNTGASPVFPGNFASDFSNSAFAGTADTFGVVPEPSSYALILIGLLGLAVSRRRLSA